MKRIGVLGGTFDPPHIGHFMMALYAYSDFKLEEVLFLPTGTVPHKDNNKILPAAYRLDMLRLVIDRFPYFRICCTEMNRNKTSYTYETMEELHRLYPEDQLYFIVGADSLCYMDEWREPQRIFDATAVIVVPRSGIDHKNLEDKIFALKRRYGARIFYLSMPLVELSSTEIRHRICVGKPVNFMTEPEIIRYIQENKLYQCEKEGQAVGDRKNKEIFTGQSE